MSNFWAHFRTVNRHRRIVRRLCFRLGLYRQGFTHDLSKYSRAEFAIGVKYFKGDYSPNSAERRDKGHSTAWLHHKGRNPHHMEYWVDYAPPSSYGVDGNNLLCGVEMPKKYVAEMFCDRIAACMVYQGDKYSDAGPYDYFAASKEQCIAHPKTKELLEKMLTMLKNQGLEQTLSYIKNHVL
ncbi:MAG: DUF5662 family protein [Oscillospiraceae bacterium]|nr:DUF5662 family protein [Oscillospiraceae bacterium]